MKKDKLKKKLQEFTGKQETKNNSRKCREPEITEAKKMVVEWSVEGGTEGEKQFWAKQIRGWLKDEVVETRDEFRIPISVYDKDYDGNDSTPARVKSTEPEGEVKITNRTSLELEYNENVGKFHW